MEIPSEYSLIEEIKKQGVQISDIWDLVKVPGKTYAKIIPLLVERLNLDIDEDKIKEGIVRALAIKEATGIAGDALISLFHRLPKERRSLRWAIGNSIEKIITPKEVDEVIKIVTDKNNETARQMFVLALGKINTKNSESTLIKLLSDDQVVLHAIEALGKLRSQKSRGAIEKFISHPRAVVRRTALKALKKIDKAKRD